MSQHGSIVTMTITGVPVSMNNQLCLVDCVVTVDFAQIAARFACNAAFNRSKSTTQLYGAVNVKGTNVRPRS